MKSNLTESRALQISSLNRSVRILLVVKSSSKIVHDIKLSWILHLLTNVLWALDTKSFTRGESCVAIILPMIFAMASIRLIDLKSLMSSPPSFV
jgi:hypothetical protein